MENRETYVFSAHCDCDYIAFGKKKFKTLNFVLAQKFQIKFVKH